MTMLCVALLCIGALWVCTARSYSDLAQQQDNSPMDVSPQCRQNALQVLNGNFGHALGERFCHHLSYAQKQLLALELTKCHLDEMQQATFETPCTVSVQECLAHLTPLGFQSYTLFKINIEQYCIKLNHDLMILQQLETGAQLQQTAKLASEQLAEIMQQQGEMHHEYSKLYSSLHEGQMELHQTLIQQSMQRQQDLELQLLEWTRQMMKGQEKQIQLQRQELQYLSTAMDKTASHIKPLLALDATLSLISGGFHIVNLFIYLYITVNLQWLLTLPQCVRSCRHKLWALAVLEFLLHCSFIWLSGNTATTNETFIETVRVSNRILQVTVYVHSFFLSFFATNLPVAGGEQHQQELLMLLKHVDDTTKRMQNQIQECDNCIIQLLQQQQNSDRQQMALQRSQTSHVATATSPTLVEAKSNDQFQNCHEWQIDADQWHSCASALSTAGLIPSQLDEKKSDEAFGVHGMMSTNTTNIASPQTIQSPDIVFNTVSDTSAFMTPPLHASDMALNDKKRSRGSDVHDTCPSKRLCAKRTN